MLFFEKMYGFIHVSNWRVSVEIDIWETSVNGVLIR